MKCTTQNGEWLTLNYLFNQEESISYTYLQATAVLTMSEKYYKEEIYESNL